MAFGENEFKRNESIAELNISVSEYQQKLSMVLNYSFLFMFIALLLTANTALITVKTGFFAILLTNPPIYLALAVADIIIVTVCGALIRKNNLIPSAILFTLYSVINGIIFSSILVIYTGESIVSIFFVTAVVFAVMAIFGYTTKTDLTRYSRLFFMGLISVIIVSLVNMLLFKSSLLDVGISVFAVILFLGIIAYDMQKIKLLCVSQTGLSDYTLGLYGAIEFYLDFINLFLRLLRLFGKRR